METLETVCARERLTCTYRASDKPAPWDNAPKHRLNGWRVKLAYRGRSLTVDFWTGQAHAAPRAWDVIGCLVSDAQTDGQTFEEWCRDLGYDTDSRKAEQTWKACNALAPRVRRLLGSDFDTFANAEH